MLLHQTSKTCHRGFYYMCIISHLFSEGPPICMHSSNVCVSLPELHLLNHISSGSFVAVAVAIDADKDWFQDVIQATSSIGFSANTSALAL